MWCVDVSLLAAQRALLTVLCSCADETATWLEPQFKPDGGWPFIYNRLDVDKDGLLSAVEFSYLGKFLGLDAQEVRFSVAHAVAPYRPLSVSQLVLQHARPERGVTRVGVCDMQGLQKAIDDKVRPCTCAVIPSRAIALTN